MEDTPLETFVKNGPLNKDIVPPGTDDLWTLLVALAQAPQGNARFPEWRDLRQAHEHLMDLLLGYRAELINTVRLEYGRWGRPDRLIPREIRIRLRVRNFEFVRSSLDYQLLVYPQGMIGDNEPIALPLDDAEFDPSDKTGGVQEIVLTHRPDEAFIREHLSGLDSELILLTRLRVDHERGDTLPRNSADGVERFFAVRQPAVAEQMALGPGSGRFGNYELRHNHNPAVHERRTGTKAELLSPRFWLKREGR